MHTNWRLCLSALLFHLVACSTEVDQTAFDPEPWDPRASDDPLGNDGRLNNDLPGLAGPTGEQCTAQPGGGRYSLCGSVTSTPRGLQGGNAVNGSTLSFAPVRSEKHTLMGAIRAN
jgi:hypothetical protein